MKLYRLFAEYNKLQMENEESEKNRRQLDKSGKYQPGKNDLQYPNFFRAFGQGELNNKKKMILFARDIKNTFPLAALILDDCFDILREKGSEDNKRAKLETHIYNKTSEVIERLSELVKAIEFEGHTKNLKPSDDIELVLAKTVLDGFRIEEKVILLSL